MEALPQSSLLGWAPIRRIANMSRRTRVIVTCVALFILALAAFLPGIESPGKLYFDEVHYIPAAREMLNTGIALNAEHPPLAKELMAVGIALFGDNPLGWRSMSAVFGALALVGVYLWTLALFRNEWAAWWATAITLSNQVLYVQARIAMLDVFAVAFMIGALAAFSASWQPPSGMRTKRLLIAAGVLLGLAIGCKWIGLLPWFLIVGTVIAIKVLQGWKTRFDEPAESDWYRADLWQGIGPGEWLLYLAAIPFAVYYLTFLPLGWSELLPDRFIDAQMTMWRENATLAGTHPYMSAWTGWPVLARPIWYFFEDTQWDTSKASAQAVLFLGNPLVYWVGIAGIGACLYGWLVQRRKEAFLIFTAYGVLYFAWGVIPRHLAFSFYYLPAAMVLGPALACLFYQTRLGQWPWTRRAFLAGCILLLAYFLPISNAAVHVSEPGYNRLTWFQSWR